MAHRGAIQCTLVLVSMAVEVSSRGLNRAQCRLMQELVPDHARLATALSRAGSADFPSKAVAT